MIPQDISVMSTHSVWHYMRVEFFELLEWAKCGEGCLSTVPTALWAAGAAMLARRLLVALFRRFLFRRVPLWEILLQHLLFAWMVIYSLHFWVMFVRVVKVVVDFCYEDEALMSQEDMDAKKMMQQWMVWMCGLAPLAYFIHTRPRPENPPLMIWITTSPWQRREMGPYGYYLNRPLQPLPPQPAPARHTALRRAFSDSRVLLRDPPKRKRHSKSV